MPDARPLFFIDLTPANPRILPNLDLDQVFVAYGGAAGLEEPKRLGWMTIECFCENPDDGPADAGIRIADHSAERQQPLHGPEHDDTCQRLEHLQGLLDPAGGEKRLKVFRVQR